RLTTCIDAKRQPEGRGHDRLAHQRRALGAAIVAAIATALSEIARVRLVDGRFLGCELAYQVTVAHASAHDLFLGPTGWAEEVFYDCFVQTFTKVVVRWPSVCSRRLTHDHGQRLHVRDTFPFQESLGDLRIDRIDRVRLVLARIPTDLFEQTILD